MHCNTLFVRYFVPVFTGLTMIALFLGLRFYGVIGALFLSVFIVGISIGMAGRVGSSVANRLYGTGSKTLTLNEQLGGELHQIRYLKRSGEFAKTLVQLDSLLDRAPEYPEALFLKAEILQEGFGNRKETIKCLREVIRLTTADEVVNRWARNMFEEVG